MNKDHYLISEKMLDVGDGHSLYIHEWGNANASTPIIFLHGGPGSHVRNSHKRVFDPTIHRVIFFDQRGSGKSTPYGSLENNTTDKLIEDISKIADSFGIKNFILRGNSWGSTLALAYALAHPERVHSLVLGGILPVQKPKQTGSTKVNSSCSSLTFGKHTSTKPLSSITTTQAGTTLIKS